MPSSTDLSPAAGPPSPAPQNAARLLRWNRRLHSYLGLYLLFFVWLFSLTGLLLNHPQWKFASFWQDRRETTYERDIVPPQPGGDVAQARDLMRQLVVRGEIDWTITRNDPAQLDFRASRPGAIYEIKADLSRNKASVKHIDLNAWGVACILHTFTGVRTGDLRNSRDWFMTSVWILTMDAVSVGLVLTVLSSYFMWLELPRKRKAGGVVLAAGFVTCALFCFGLRWVC